jgi:hypothetical protein
MRPALDLGILYDKRKPWKTKFGLVAKNINSPDFEQPDAAKAAGVTEDFHLDTQLRGGVAFYPFRFWSISSDIDLTNNRTSLPGFASRQWGLGTEINIFNRRWLNIPLRAGIMKNVAEKSSDLAYTGGFGLNFLHLTVDVGGAVSSERVNIDSTGNSQEVPTNLQVALTLGLNF